MMKKIMIVVAAMLMLSGCSALSADKEGTDAGSADTENTQGSDESETASADYLEMYTLEVPSDSEEYPYLTRYTLVIKDDSNASVEEATIYNDKRENVSSYIGTYKKTDYGYEFSYEEDSQEGYSFIYKFFIENGTMTEAVIDNDGVSDLAGTYEGSSKEYGNMILTINRDASVTLETEVEEFTGYMSKYEGEWSLMAYNEESGNSIDWYVYFSGSKFTYNEYYAELYGDHAGPMTIDGMLGKIEVFLSEEGNAYATVELDGTMVDLQGYYYVDSLVKEVTEIYLSSDTGYELNLYIADIGEEYPNYSGTVSYPLGAG